MQRGTHTQRERGGGGGVEKAYAEGEKEKRGWRTFSVKSLIQTGPTHAEKKGEK